MLVRESLLLCDVDVRVQSQSWRDWSRRDLSERKRKTWVLVYQWPGEMKLCWLTPSRVAKHDEESNGLEKRNMQFQRNNGRHRAKSIQPKPCVTSTALPNMTARPRHANQSSSSSSSSIHVYTCTIKARGLNLVSWVIKVVFKWFAW